MGRQSSGSWGYQQQEVNLSLPLSSNACVKGKVQNLKDESREERLLKRSGELLGTETSLRKPYRKEPDK